MKFLRLFVFLLSLPLVAVAAAFWPREEFDEWEGRP